MGSEDAQSRAFRKGVFRLAQDLGLTPRQMRIAFCLLSHCACSETPPPIPMVRAEIQDAKTEQIMAGVFRGQLEIEAFGRSRAAVLGFYSWLEGYLPDYEERVQADVQEYVDEGDTPPHGFSAETQVDLGS